MFHRVEGAFTAFGAGFVVAEEDLAQIILMAMRQTNSDGPK